MYHRTLKDLRESCLSKEYTSAIDAVDSGFHTGEKNEQKLD